jgi:transposase
LENCGAIDLFFGDESGFSMTPCIPYGWQEKGKQIGLVPRDSKRLNVLGFLNLDNRIYAYPTEDTINGDFVCKAIDDLSEKMDKTTVIVLDNAPIHRCQKFYDNIEKWQEKGVFIFFLPKYSPHLNIIEILWKKIKYEWLKPQHFTSYKRMKKEVKRILTQLANEFIIKFKRTLNT